MPPQTLALAPFEASAPAVTINGSLTLAPPREAPSLLLELEVRSRAGQRGLDRLAIPRPTAGSDERRDGLWQHTCLECFLAPAGQPTYLEFNLAPDGAWNVYELDDYRQGLRAAVAYGNLPFRCELRPDSLSLRLHCPLPTSWAGLEAIDWQVSAVLEALDGSLSHWALRHPPDAADFHDRQQWSRAQLL